MALIYEVKKQVLGFKEGKPTVYKVAAVRQQIVTYEKLVKEVASSCGVHRTQTKAVVEGLIDRMVHYMDFGMPVRLGEFGTFKPVIHTKTKMTMEEVSADNVVRRVVRFFPGKRMKDMLKELSIQTFETTSETENEDETTDEGNNSDSGSGTGTGSNPL